jgi:23S rRNA pseudouridine2605 synthase
VEERLQKIIAQSGMASRRNAEILIQQGKVRVNGKVVRILGTKANPTTDHIAVDGKPLRHEEKIAYLLFKAKGVVSSKVQQGDAPIVTDYVPKEPPVYPVGRLDRESEGLIIMTNDGELTHHLTHPSFLHQKEYVAEVTWKDTKAAEPTIKELTTRLQKTIKLSDGKVQIDHVHVTAKGSKTRILTLTVHEGRHHLIRRICATMGYRVKRLQRTRISFLTATGLKPGTYRRLTPAEVTKLHRSHDA